MMIELSIEDARWQALDLDALAEQAVSGTLAHLDLEAELCEISILACDDTRIAALNAEFREKPTPTNVLSWPAEDLSTEEAGGQPLAPEPDFTGEIALGDIALSFDTCTREALDACKPLQNHVLHLLVHGTLHLLGYDHIRDPDATLMEALEVEILGKMGVDNPYSHMESP